MKRQLDWAQYLYYVMLRVGKSSDSNEQDAKTTNTDISAEARDLIEKQNALNIQLY